MIRELLQKALDRSLGVLSVDDVLTKIARQEMQLWECPNSVAVTQISRLPQKTVANIALAAGDLNELLDLVPLIEDWAKTQGADVVTVVGRKGWAKALSGYQEQAVFLAKPLRD